MTSESESVECARVYWHSRRGMLELDLVLMPFAENVYPTLDEEDRRCYRALLECEDADMFAWLVHGVEAADPDIDRIIRRIRDHGRPATENQDQGI